MTQLLTPEQVAELLAVDVETLYKWRSRPTPYGPQAIKVGKYLRWQAEDVEAWIAAQFAAAAGTTNVTQIATKRTA